MPQLAAGETLEVIVSFHGNGALTPVQLDALRALGLPGVSMRAQPMAGVRATPAHIQQLLAMPSVRSVWHNAPLDLE